MTALAATGRQAEALRVYDDFRRLLGDELGIEPSPALAAQHAALLAGEPAPAWAAGRRRLPVPATSLVGRDDAGRRASIAPVDAHRLVTLVGPGGVGKTRLLVEVGHRLQAARPDRPVVLCELADRRRRRRRSTWWPRRSASTPGPGVRSSSGSPTCSATAEVVLLLDNCEHVLDPVAAARRAAARPLPERAGGGDEPGAAAGAGRARPRRARRCRRRRRRARGRSCSSSGPGPSRPASTPTATELAARRRDRAPARRPAAGDRAGRRPPAHPRRRRGRRRARPPLRAAVVGLPHLDPPRLARRRRVVVVRAARRATCSETFADLSVFAGLVRRRRRGRGRAASMPAAIGRRRWPSSSSGRWSCARPAGGTCCSRRCGRSAPSSSPPPAAPTPSAERHARHHVEWVERRRPAAARAGPRRCIAEIDAAVPELRTALGWLLDHGEVELAGRLVAALLRLRRSCGCAPTCWRGPSG